MEQIIPNIETLVVTMHLKSAEELINHMNIQTAFVVGNQDDDDGMRKVCINDKEGIIITRRERGVGKNRNTVLFSAKAPICIFADDDMAFYDNYAEIVYKVFSENEEADVIIFNLGGTEEAYQGERRIERKTKINILNYMNFGAARMAVRRDAILYHGISFNLNFGGGTIHQCGEDSLFLRDCLAAGLKVVAVSESIAEIYNSRESTWFNGYNDKYFFDKGVFLGVAHPWLAHIFAFYLVMRHKEYISGEQTRVIIYKKIREGIRYVKRRYRV